MISMWIDSNSQSVSRSKYRGTGIATTKGFAAFGVGFSIPLDSSIRVKLESRFTQTFDSKETFLPVLSTVQFDL